MEMDISEACNALKKQIEAVVRITVTQATYIQNVLSSLGAPSKKSIVKRKGKVKNTQPNATNSGSTFLIIFLPKTSLSDVNKAVINANTTHIIFKIPIGGKFHFLPTCKLELTDQDL